jgi:hypothetical protein
MIMLSESIQNTEQSPAQEIERYVLELWVNNLKSMTHEEKIKVFKELQPVFTNSVQDTSK